MKTMKTKLKRCKNCEVLFPGFGNQRFCSEKCKDGWHFRQATFSRELQAIDAEIKADLQEQHDHKQLGLKRFYCRNCFRLQWAKSIPSDGFCSEACRVIYNGGQTRSMRRKEEL